jgi:hypothetical protein
MAVSRLLAAFTIGAMWAAQTPSPSPVAADFQKNISKYMKLRKDAISSVAAMKSNDSPEKIHQHERDLAQSIRAARADAKQGDIFTPPVTAEFRRMMGKALTSPGAARVKKSVKDVEPSPLPAIVVNGAYPTKDPVQSMPPSLLRDLPPLPRELEYRVVGRTLILHDIDANLIVDYINEAFQ